MNDKQAQARLAVSRHACALFWERGVAGTSGDDIAAAAGLSTRTIWRYFRTKESCVEPVLARTVDRFIGMLQRWPLELSLADHLAADAVAHPLTPRRSRTRSALCASPPCPRPTPPCVPRT